MLPTIVHVTFIQLVLLLIGLPVQAISSDELAGFMASSSNEHRQMLDYTRFLGSDSRVPDHLKRAIQIVETHDTLPSCGKMAVSALMYSCATLEANTAAEDDRHVQNRAPDVDLKGEKVLYATRLAVCELSESKAYVPRECKSFIPTKDNTKKTGFLGFFTENGPSKPIVSYPKYEEATNQDLDICLSALQNSAQTWTSYSNARQDAVNLCHAVRGDIEKDEILHLHKILTENTASNAEALGLMRENAQETREAFHHLVVSMRQFSVDLHQGNAEAQAKFSQMWLDVEEKVRTGMHDLADQVDRIKSRTQDSDIQVREFAQNVHGVISEIVTRFNTLMQQHETNLALASKSADNVQECVEFVNQILQQKMLQALSVALKKVQSVDALSGDALQNVQVMKSETAIANDQLAALASRLVDTLGVMQQLADGHDDIRASVNATRDSIASLKTDVLAISGYLSAVAETIVTAFNRIPLIAWCIFYLTSAAGILFFLALFPGGSFVLQSCGGLVRSTMAAAGNVSSALVRLTWSALLAVAKNILGLVGLLGILTAVYHFKAFEIAVHDAVQGLSEDQKAAFHFGAACSIFVIVIVVAILAKRRIHSHFAEDDNDNQDQNDKHQQKKPPALKQGRFWFNDPKKYKHRKWAV